MPRDDWSRESSRQNANRAAASGSAIRRDGTTLMPFGKHKGSPLDAVPEDYLRWLLTQDWLNTGLRNDIQRTLSGDVDRQFQRMFGGETSAPEKPARAKPAKRRSKHRRGRLNTQSPATHVPFTMPNGKVTLILKEWVGTLGGPEDVCPFDVDSA